MKDFVTVLLASVGLFVALVGTIVCVVTWSASRDEAKLTAAKAYCESFIPHIEATRQAWGRYPKQIDHAWLKDREMPSWISIAEFYWSDGEHYSLSFHPHGSKNDTWFYVGWAKQWYHDD